MTLTPGLTCDLCGVVKPSSQVHHTVVHGMELWACETCLRGSDDTGLDPERCVICGMPVKPGEPCLCHVPDDDWGLER